MLEATCTRSKRQIQWKDKQCAAYSYSLRSPTLALSPSLSNPKQLWNSNTAIQEYRRKRRMLKNCKADHSLHSSLLPTQNSSIANPEGVGLHRENYTGISTEDTSNCQRQVKKKSSHCKIRASWQENPKGPTSYSQDTYTWGRTQEGTHTHTDQRVVGEGLESMRELCTYLPTH